MYHKNKTLEYIEAIRFWRMLLLFVCFMHSNTQSYHKQLFVIHHHTNYAFRKFIRFIDGKSNGFGECSNFICCRHTLSYTMASKRYSRTLAYIFQSVKQLFTFSYIFIRRKYLHSRNEYSFLFYSSLQSLLYLGYLKLSSLQSILRSFGSVSSAATFSPSSSSDRFEPRGTIHLNFSAESE